MKSNLWIGAKFNETDVEIVHQVVEARGEDVSSFLRRAVKRELAMLGYLEPAQAKALGIAESARA